VARRRSTFELFMEVASRLPWPICLALAAGSAILLHLLSIHLAIPNDASGIDTTVHSLNDVGGLYARTLYGTLAKGLQFIVPTGFLFAGLASFIKRLQARALLTQAQSAPGQAISTMTWSQFERLIGESFRHRGYKVAETGGGGSDGGVDLHLTKDGKSFLVQCKHWRTQRVGVSIVRELNGVIAARHAAGGFVVTSGQFTPEAWHFAQSCQIELIDGDRLTSLLREIESKAANSIALHPADKPVVTPLAPEINTCPECGSAMTRRTAKRGQFAGHDFLGCTRYPACRGVRQIAPLGGGS
jgi:restriction system protein